MKTISSVQEISQHRDWRSNVPIVACLSLAVGVLSGFINYLLSRVDGRLGLGILLWGAGFFFGIITLPWIFFILRKEMTKIKMFIVSLLWIVISCLSYFIAVFSTGAYSDFTFIESFTILEYLIENYGISGLVGAFIVASSFHFLFQKITRPVLVSLCVVGLIIPIVVVKIFGDIGGGDSEVSWSTIMFLFTIWQGVITAILGYALVRKVVPSDSSVQ
jgi:hypothetical protein